MMRVFLGGLEFVGEVGKATYTIERDGIRGHGLGGADMRRNEENRPTSHGAFEGPAYLTGRSIRWGGLVLTDSVFAQENALLRLAGLLADGGSGTLVIEQANGSLRASVQRASPEPPRVLVPGRVASYSFEVWAPDPRLYGQGYEYAAGEKAIHRGNFPAVPRFVVQGPQPAYTISVPGKQYVVDDALPSGSVDEIDMETGWCRRDGTILRTAVSRADTWTVPPGAAGVVHSFSGTASRFTVQLEDTSV